MTKKARGWSMGLAVLILAGSATPPDAPVADAAMKGDIEAVRVLLKAGAEVNAPQGDGMTALHWAAETGNLQLANLLIFAGANLEAVTRVARYTPLLIAAEAAHGALVEALVEAGANVDARTVGGATALHVAGKAGDVA
jgi:ankyrin repeat protein